jgi:DNA-binding response OmpR family regulator
MKILIVEDATENMAEAIVAFQSDHDFIICSSYDEEEIARVNKFSPDVGLVDVHILKGSGYDFGRILHKKNIPFLYVTSSADGILIKNTKGEVLRCFEKLQSKTREVWEYALQKVR